jgi:beta-lactamase regulating signal transducer with metallopeptidase domain
MNWLHYLLEANLYLVVFYTGYCLFLNKETYYTLNRAYLLLSCILSFLLPVMQIGALKPVESGVVKVILLAPSGLKSATTEDSPVSHITPITVDDVLLYTYLLGVMVLALVLIFKIFRLIKMTRTTIALVDDKYKLIGIDGSNTAFSFFNYLFIGTKTAGSDIIIRHELVHIRQKHSADIIFMELIKIINWFNPFIYLVQISLKTVHEYIADEQTAAHETDALAYSSFLVNNAYGLNGSSVTHSFFNYNLLKKRIIMLNQKRSGSLARLKYLMAVPICAAALCASTLGFSKTYALIDLAPRRHTVPTADYKAANIATDTTRLINRNQVTSKGYKYDEDGYLINGKTDFRVIITEKNGEQKEYFKHSAKPADLAMLKNKYGYSFPKMLIHPKLPPPPPIPAPQSGLSKMPPPPPPAKVKKGVKVIDVTLIPPPAKSGEPAPPAPVQAPGEAVPPPPPPKDPFNDLYTYIARHVRYPTAALNNHIAGRITVVFNINNGKIEDAKITRGLDDMTNGEVMRVIKNYDGPLYIKSGKYAIPVSYRLVDENDNSVGKEPEYKALTNDYKILANDKNKPGTNDITVSDPVSSLNEVVIVGYAAKKQ